MTSIRTPIVIHAGARAAAHIRARGLLPDDIAVIPAGAGGPKGLILHGLDRFVFGEWLPRAPRERHFIGASIGAWRMDSALQPGAVGALERLVRLYAEQQYPPNPAPAYISRVCRDLVDQVVDNVADAFAHCVERADPTIMQPLG